MSITHTLEPLPKNKRSIRADAQLIVAASETDANLLYATRFFAPDPFIFFVHHGKKFLVMSDLEIDRARQQAQVRSVLSLSQFEKRLKDSKRKVIGTAAVLHLLFSSKKIHSLLVPYGFPVGLAEQLRRKGFRIIVKPDPFWGEREFKQPQEIREIEKALRAAEAGMEAGIETIKDSKIHSNGTLYWNGSRLTSEAVKQRINAVILDKGCIATHTIVACGNQGCDPHREGSGPLKAHQPIILDIFPRSQGSGYWGDITRTVVRGQASQRLKAMFQAVLRGQEIAFRQIKSGANGNEIHQSILDYFSQQGFETNRKNNRMQGFFHGTGHGVGLEIHEAPRISPKAKERLKAGHVVTVEPGLYYLGLGGVRLEDLVVVTDTGNRNLTRFPKILEA
jgi:Xaa-Pro aminopeptidase